MKYSYCVVAILILIFTLTILAEIPFTENLRWIARTVLSFLISTCIKSILSVTGSAGTAFSALVEVSANYPYIWESVSSQFPAEPSQPLLPCPPGFLPAPNRSHSPSSDGCGTDNLKIDIRHLLYQDHEECCNAHDVCYDNCHIISSKDVNLHRTQCDLNFKTCLHWVCTLKSMQRSVLCSFYFLLTSSFWNENCESVLRDELEKNFYGYIGNFVLECKASVEILYSSVNSWGFAAYRKAQELACICLPEEADN